MKIEWEKGLKQQPRLILEEAGYHAFVDPNTDKLSFVMRLDQGFYPRYHLYVVEKPNALILDLHIDQKKASYEGQTAHSGEYDGPLVEEEVARLQRWLVYYSG
ncbi:hypothetical protein ACFL2M_01165 [Patescibacteria group bacterium]